ncbi:MAG: adenine nucleotide alpha hydrolase [Betaproteobacteria bacterium]|nr:MAG: adenine nucleotide alpha hydrolase [Betaproteobacteria bacterium]
MDGLDALTRIIDQLPGVAVAVSGGVDSLTLATAIHRRHAVRATMFHAVSPAVPEEATERVRAVANKQGWVLRIIDAGEFADRDYRANPVNRCFYCKTNLYGAIAPLTDAQIVSGTNLDDLGEYRPGLQAAEHHSVRHPFVEAGIDKTGVRLLARRFGLGGISELPAAPCLSSRIETGIAIDPSMLKLVHQTERFIADRLHPKTVRCRVRANGVVVELDKVTLDLADELQRDELARHVATLFSDAGLDYRVSFAPYRVGSAFVHLVHMDV